MTKYIDLYKNKILDFTKNYTNYFEKLSNNMNFKKFVIILLSINFSILMTYHNIFKIIFDDIHSKIIEFFSNQKYENSIFLSFLLILYISLAVIILIFSSSNYMKKMLAVTFIFLYLYNRKDYFIKSVSKILEKITYALSTFFLFTFGAVVVLIVGFILCKLYPKNIFNKYCNIGNNTGNNGGDNDSDDDDDDDDDDGGDNNIKYDSNDESKNSDDNNIKYDSNDESNNSDDNTSNNSDDNNNDGGDNDSDDGGYNTSNDGGDNSGDDPSKKRKDTLKILSKKIKMNMENIEELESIENQIIKENDDNKKEELETERENLIETIQKDIYEQIKKYEPTSIYKELFSIYQQTTENLNYILKLLKIFFEIVYLLLWLIWIIIPMVFSFLKIVFVTPSSNSTVTPSSNSINYTEKLLSEVATFVSSINAGMIMAMDELINKITYYIYQFYNQVPELQMDNYLRVDSNFININDNVVSAIIDIDTKPYLYRVHSPMLQVMEDFAFISKNSEYDFQIVVKESISGDKNIHSKIFYAIVKKETGLTSDQKTEGEESLQLYNSLESTPEDGIKAQILLEKYFDSFDDGTVSNFYSYLTNEQFDYYPEDIKELIQISHDKFNDIQEKLINDKKLNLARLREHEKRFQLRDNVFIFSTVVIFSSMFYYFLPGYSYNLLGSSETALVPYVQDTSGSGVDYFIKPILENVLMAFDLKKINIIGGLTEITEKENQQMLEDIMDLYENESYFQFIYKQISTLNNIIEFLFSNPNNKEYKIRLRGSIDNKS